MQGPVTTTIAMATCQGPLARQPNRLTATMTNILSDKKRHSLAALYQQMPMEALERRIAGGQLAAPAQAIAQEVLNSRLEHGDAAPEPASAAQGAPRGSVWGTAMLLAMGAAFSWLVLPGHLAALVTLVAVCWVVPALGKAFPRIGLALGIFCALVPVGLSLWAWRTEALVMRGGDYKPLGALLAWLALIIAFALFWSLASLLIFGSRHKGSWGDLHDELETMRDEQTEAITRRR